MDFVTVQKCLNIRTAGLCTYIWGTFYDIHDMNILFLMIFTIWNTCDSETIGCVRYEIQPGVFINL